MAYLAGAVERAMKVQEVILRALSGQLTWLQAADILGRSPRSIRRLRWRYQHYGYDGLFDRRRRTPSPRRAPVAEVERLLHLYRTHDDGFNVRHFRRKARQAHGVPFCDSFVKKALRAPGWSPSSGLAAAIAAGASRARASASCSTSTAAGISGWASCQSNGSRSSPSWTMPPSESAIPNSPPAARAPHRS